MKITKLGSATVIIETTNSKILCDPWLIDGAYYGSWCNFPPIDLDKIKLDDIDYIYLSHIHPDHFDSNTMAFISRSVPVLIHKYHQKFFKRSLERLNFNVIELDNGVSYPLKGNEKISVYAADNCDPTICGRMFGCISENIVGSMQLDSLCVIEDSGYVLVNTNDCPYEIAEQALKDVKSKYKDIDFVLTGYTSASLYPHCMMNYSKKQMDIGKEYAKKRGLTTAINTVSLLNPDNYMLFAGTYILGGYNFKKNKNLPIPEITDAVSYIETELVSKNIRSSPILLNYLESFDVKSQTQSKPYVPVNIEERENYIHTKAKYFKYDFENDDFPSNDEIFDLFKKSIIRLRKKQLEVSLFEDLNLVFDVNEDLYIVINLEDLELRYIRDISILNNYHRFKLDTRLLKRALRGPHLANWNNIEIGAHLEFDRKPDIFRNDVHILINALHA